MLNGLDPLRKGGATSLSTFCLSGAANVGRQDVCAGAGVGTVRGESLLLIGDLRVPSWQ